MLLLDNNKNNTVNKMLDAVKEALTKEIDVKEILTKEIHVKEFLEMEIELTKLKQLLATEIKLKEFLIQEIDFTSFLSKKSLKKPVVDSIDIDVTSDNLAVDEVNVQQSDVAVEAKVEEISPKRNLPGYDFSLIEGLYEEHKKIRFIYNRLMSFAIDKDYAKVAGQLESFNAEVREHYKKTDIELYSYLRIYVQIKYPKREKAFTQLSLEMKNISIEIFYIISQSPNVPLTEQTYDAFMKEFIAVGKLINERINREQELLFKMYEQTNTAKSIS